MDVLKTKFTVTGYELLRHPINSVEKMIRESALIAQDLGLKNHGDQDSFRHAYTSAKVADLLGIGMTRVYGSNYEFQGQGGTFEDHLADLGNNAWGLAIREAVDRQVAMMVRQQRLNEDSAGDYREWLLRTEIAKAVKDGRMTQQPFGRQRDGRTLEEIFVRGYLRWASRADRAVDWLQGMLTRGENSKPEKTGFYIWRTAGDDKVRPDHAARDGQVFTWSSPPPGGNPGEDFNCRCWAEPLGEEKRA